METEVAEKKRVYRKLGLSKEETQDVVKHLNFLLVNYNVHYQKLRNFHWNVKGHDFFDLHEFFEEQYNTAQENIDIVAERIRVFGHTPISTMQEYLEKSDIKEAGTDLTAEEMAEEILQDFSILLSFMVDVTDEASSIGDVGSVELMNSFIEKMEKSHWMLNAWLGK